MPQTIDVGDEEIEFPDSYTPDQITAAVRKHKGLAGEVSAQPEAETDFSTGAVTGYKKPSEPAKQPMAEASPDMFSDEPSTPLDPLVQAFRLKQAGEGLQHDIARVLPNYGNDAVAEAAMAGTMQPHANAQARLAGIKATPPPDNSATAFTRDVGGSTFMDIAKPATDLFDAAKTVLGPGYDYLNEKSGLKAASEAVKANPTGGMLSDIGTQAVKNLGHIFPINKPQETGELVGGALEHGAGEAAGGMLTPEGIALLGTNQIASIARLSAEQAAHATAALFAHFSAQGIEQIAPEATRVFSEWDTMSSDERQKALGGLLTGAGFAIMPVAHAAIEARGGGEVPAPTIEPRSPLDATISRQPELAPFHEAFDPATAATVLRQTAVPELARSGAIKTDGGLPMGEEAIAKGLDDLASGKESAHSDSVLQALANEAYEVVHGSDQRRTVESESGLGPAAAEAPGADGIQPGPGEQPAQGIGNADPAALAAGRPAAALRPEGEGAQPASQVEAPTEGLKTSQQAGQDATWDALGRGEFDQPIPGKKAGEIATDEMSQRSANAEDLTRPDWLEAGHDRLPTGGQDALVRQERGVPSVTDEAVGARGMGPALRSALDAVGRILGGDARVQPEGGGLRSRSSILRDPSARREASVLTDDLRSGRNVSAVGRDASSIESTAVSLQVFSAADFETMHFLGIDKGRIAAQMAHSSHLPMTVQFDASPKTAREVWDWAQREGVKKIANSHNHPTGNATPSSPETGSKGGGDTAWTKVFAQEWEKLNQQFPDKRIEYVGHFMIDHGHYGFVSPDGVPSVHELPKGTVQPKTLKAPGTEHASLGRVVTTLEDAASAAKAFHDANTHVTVALVGHGGAMHPLDLAQRPESMSLSERQQHATLKTRSISSIPVEMFDGAHAADYILAKMGKEGAHMAVAYYDGSHPEMAAKLRAMVADNSLRGAVVNGETLDAVSDRRGTPGLRFGEARPAVRVGAETGDMTTRANQQDETWRKAGEGAFDAVRSNAPVHGSVNTPVSVNRPLEGPVFDRIKAGEFNTPGTMESARADRLAHEEAASRKADAEMLAKPDFLEAGTGDLEKKKEHFYSAVEKAVDNLKFNRMPADQLEAYLKKQPGVKAEELADRKNVVGETLPEFLKGKGHVTKEELKQFFDESRVEVKVIEKSDVREAARMRWQHGNLEDETKLTKFGQYTLPGGENYREVLLTLPTQPDRYSPNIKRLLDARDQAQSAKEAALASGDRGLARHLSVEWERLDHELGRAWDTEPSAQPNFMGSHWSEPNVLAHIRLNDRTGPNGEKILHVEEVQSDAQQLAKAQMAGGELFGKAEKPNPDFPFKKSWPLLSLKHALKEAVEGGYDKLTWTTGEQQAARYDLNKQVQNITYDTHGNLRATDHAGKTVIAEAVRPDDLPNVIGKEAAQKLLARPVDEIPGYGVNERARILSGLDLKVGGEGMKGFYDEILPAEVNKYVKKWGGKVGEGEIDPTLQLPDGYTGMGMDGKGRRAGEKVHSLDITPSMRAAIGEEGQALWAPHEDFKGGGIEERKKEGFSSEEIEQFGEGLMTLAKKGVLKESLQYPLPDKAAQYESERVSPEDNAMAGKATRGKMRELLGETARRDAIAFKIWKGVEHLVDRLNAKTNGDAGKEFWQGIQSRRDTLRENPTLKPVIDMLENALDARGKEITDLAPHELVMIEDYFKNLWKDPKAAGDFLRDMRQRNPLEGDKGFMKERIYKDIQAGLQHGLELATENPIEALRLSLHQMDKFLMGRKLLNWGLENNVFVDMGAEGARSNVGMQKLAIPGNIWAPEAAAKVVNRYLTPGLSDSTAYKTLRNAGNTMLMARLGWSAFHIGFTSLDAYNSSIALGFKRMGSGIGNRDIGQFMHGVANIPGAFLKPFTNPAEAGKYKKEYLNPGSQSPEVQVITSMMARGNMNMSPADMYHTSGIEQTLKAIRTSNFGEFEKGGKAPLATGKVVRDLWNTAKASGPAEGLANTYHLAQAVIETPTRGVMHVAQLQKIGVAADMIRFEMEDLVKKKGYKDFADAMEHERPEILDEIADRVVNSVDNRMGMLNKDNLFWNNTVKDVLALLVQSTSWNYGTIAEIGGGLWNTRKLATGDTYLNGEKAARLQHNTAYLAAMPVGTALIGAMTQFLYTGQLPSSAKDCYFPRTGRQNADGSDERLSLPTYMKDLVAYFGGLANDQGRGLMGRLANEASQLGSIAAHKAHPLISRSIELAQNKDFYGNQIWDPDGTTEEQLMQTLKSFGDSFKPYAFSGAEQRAKTRAANPDYEPKHMPSFLDKAAPFVGFTPASAKLSRSPLVNEMSDYKAAHRDPAARTFKEQDKREAKDLLRNAVKSGSEEDIDTVLGSGRLTDKEMQSAMQQAGHDPLEGQFRSLPMDEMARLWKMASKDEKERLAPYLYNRATKSVKTEEDFNKYEAVFDDMASYLPQTTESK